MISNREIKWINSLKNKKYRLKHRAYIAEGPRLVNDLIKNGQEVLKILRLEHVHIEGQHREGVVVDITADQLKQLSGMMQPNGVLGVFSMPEDIRTTSHPKGKWGFALDFIQDPGNLGTIIRTLAWFGIDHLYCSSDSVDVFNPKVVQASMGSIGRIHLQYVDLVEFLKAQVVPVYAAAMDGEPLPGIQPEPGIIVLGNEGNGLSDKVKEVCDKAISIPKIGSGESLNVAVSTAIFAAMLQLR